MSGGRFNYSQDRITYIYLEIEEYISHNDHEFSEEAINEFKQGITLLKKAQVYAQRIDWLLSGDDGEERFHERLAEDLSKLELSEISEGAKAIFIAEDSMEAKRLAKSTDMALFIWELVHNGWRQFKHTDYDYETSWERISELLEEYGIDADDLVE